MKRFLSKLLLLTLFGLLIPSCQSINRSRAKTGITSSTVIFSFDDGPNAQDDTTGRLLDVLKKYEIKAFFSLLGENAEAYPDLVRRIHDEGHYIVNHGYSEKWAYRMGNDEFQNNLIMGEAAISKALGSEFHIKLYRPHGGFYSERQKTICLEQGYTIVTSNVRVYDTVIKGEQKGKAVKQILKKIEKQNGGIILLHDGRDSHLQMERELKKKPHGVFNRSWLPEAVEETIISLLNMGYNLKDYTLIEYS